MKRMEIMTALKAALQAAFPTSSVLYWRDRPPVRSDGAAAMVVYRDVSGTMQKIGTEHEHRVRVEIEVVDFGSADVGAAMNAHLDEVVRAIGANPSLGQAKTICELVAFAFDTAGDGFATGVAQLVIDVVYRTPAWSGT